MGNKSVPIQFAHGWFDRLAFFDAKNINIFFRKNTEAILPNSTRKLLRFEISEMLIAA